MERNIGSEINFGKTVSPFHSIGSSRAINRTVLNFCNASKNL